MAQKQGDHLDFGKTSKALGLILENGNTATIDAILTALGQFGYDTTMKRTKTTDGTTIEVYLTRSDVKNDTALGGGSPSSVYPTTEAAVKTYIDTLFASGASPFTDFDASTATDFPTGATLQSRYRVSVAGTVHGIVLAVGDVFYPKVSTPDETDAADWVFVQANTDAASSTVLGLVKVVADLAALEAETVPTSVVTTAVFMDYEAAHPRVKTYGETLNISSGSNGITHNLGTSRIINVMAYDSSGPILFGWTVTNGNAISLTSTKAFTSVTVEIIAI